MQVMQCNSVVQTSFFNLQCKARLAVYNENLDAVLSFYTKQNVVVDGTREIDEVFEDICKAIEAY